MNISTLFLINGLYRHFSASRFISLSLSWTWEPPHSSSLFVSVIAQFWFTSRCFSKNNKLATWQTVYCMKRLKRTVYQSLPSFLKEVLIQYSEKKCLQFSHLSHFSKDQIKSQLSIAHFFKIRLFWFEILRVYSILDSLLSNYE